MNLTNLPDEILLPSGETLRPVIGGHLNNVPFLTAVNSGVDVTQNGWANGLTEHQERQLIIQEADRRKLRYRTVKVLSRGLRGKRDLHGSLYRPSIFIFVQLPPQKATQ